MVKQTVILDKNSNVFNIPEFVQVACQYQSHITCSNDHRSFNAKSIMGMMSLNPTDGPLIISAEGADEEDAVRALLRLISKD